MRKFHPHVHLVSLEDFYIALLWATKRRENEVSPSGPRNIGQMITAGRWITVVGLSPGPGSFLWFSLEFSYVSPSCGTFPNHAVLLLCGAAMCRLQASYGSRNTRANQDRDKLAELEFHYSCSWIAVPSPAWRCTMPCCPQVSRVAPKCGASPLDKPHPLFTGLGPWEQAAGFSHQAPILIFKSFTN